MKYNQYSSAFTSRAWLASFECIFYRSRRTQYHYVNIISFIHSISFDYFFLFCIRFFSTQDFELFYKFIQVNFTSILYFRFIQLDVCACAPLLRYCIEFAYFDLLVHSINQFIFKIFISYSIKYRKSFSNMSYVRCCIVFVNSLSVRKFYNICSYW